MTELALVVLACSAALALYTFAVYPLLLWLISLGRKGQVFIDTPPDEWPMVSITVPAYNEEHQIAETVESLLSLDYPADRKQILITSDASTDRTDEIVRGYADRGVELVRQPVRAGKTAAENAVAPLLKGRIVVNTDASIRIHPGSLKRIVAPFQDPDVGLASSRDVSVAVEVGDANLGEGGYVGFEMWLRDLETKAGGIVGASGSFYAIRRELHGIPLPESLSRDFAAALHARERGFRAVSVPSATAVVPRTKALSIEFPRKVRTITRGIATLIHKRALLNPFRYGRFAWMLFSHKVCRWLLPWAAVAAFLALGVLSGEYLWARLLFGLGGLVAAVGALAWLIAGDRRLPRLLSVPAYALMGNLAAMKAGVLALMGGRSPVWEPTRRQA